MSTLKTTFAGLELRNPIVIGSSDITSTAAGCAKMDQAGAGAIILKSLFEEDVVRRTNIECSSIDHGEGADYLEAYHSSSALEGYLSLIKESKKGCSIPIIASLNCYNTERWVEYSKAIADAGADAIELNLMSFNYSAKSGDGEWERSILDTIKSVETNISIPIIIKLSSNITNPVSLTNRAYSYGVKGVVMFNSPYPVTIDIDKVAFTSPNAAKLSRSCSESLRWIALSSAALPNVDYALAAGVKSADDIVRAILVGASVVEVVGAIHSQGTTWIESSLNEVSAWCREHGFDSINEFKGRLNSSQESNREHLLRWQYLESI